MELQLNAIVEQWYCALSFNFQYVLKLLQGAAAEQSIQQLAMGWTTEGPEFKSRYGYELYVLRVIQTSSGAYPASYPMGIGRVGGCSFPRGKAAGA
jgi:hypothetical protein